MLLSRCHIQLRLRLNVHCAVRRIQSPSGDEGVVRLNPSGRLEREDPLASKHKLDPDPTRGSFSERIKCQFAGANAGLHGPLNFNFLGFNAM